MTTFEVFPDEMVGYTDEKNSSAMFGGTKANSSSSRKLNESPRTALEDVEDETTLDPFSRVIDNLFHSTTPCCNHLGRLSYANFNRFMSSVAVFSLLASMAHL
jgi:hypothetical protein